jgi:hypothetical protein
MFSAIFFPLNKAVRFWGIIRNLNEIKTYPYAKHRKTKPNFPQDTGSGR